MGDGLTVMVNVLDSPGQVTLPFTYCGVTVIVATTGVVLALIAVKDVISPVPLAPNPIDVVLLVHE